MKKLLFLALLLGLSGCEDGNQDHASSVSNTPASSNVTNEPLTLTSNNRLIYSPKAFSAVSAVSSLGGWSVTNPMAVGASILYDGLKGAVTSSVFITLNASQVAKVLRSGGAGFALSYAVEQLLGAVDWVLDPANNQIKYKAPLADGSDQTCQKSFFDNGKYYCNEQTACKAHAAYFVELYGSHVSFKSSFVNSNGDAQCVMNWYGSTTIFTLPLINRPEKTLPLETLAQKVIENAESDNLDAQLVILAAANNILSEAEQDDAKAKPIVDELENNAKCPSGIISEYGQCWICDKTLHYPMYRATRDAKNATRNRSCKNITDPAIKAANAVLFRNLISARSQENACWSPIHQNHITALNDAKNALNVCEN